MEIQLTLENISCFLPYGLEIEINNYKNDYVGIKRAKVNGYYFIGDSLHVTYEGGSTGKSISEFKPLFRPMSQLTQKITIVGKECIPIVELAKIAFPHEDFEIEYDDKGGFANGNLIDFYFEENHFFATEFEDIAVPNQLQLFQWLYKNKFDIENLIGQSLAIPVTEDNNVYN